MLKDAREDVRQLIKSRHCNPILVRAAWHDSGTYDKVGHAAAIDHGAELAPTAEIKLLVMAEVPLLNLRRECPSQLRQR